jgi:uncharacterized protein (DUF433 family)
MIVKKIVWLNRVHRSGKSLGMKAKPGPEATGKLPVETRLVCRLVQQYSSAMNLELLKRITIEPGKCGGRPCIRGMRMRVTDVLQLLSAGASYEEILNDYPDLEREDILAAIGYAAHQTDHVVLPSA